MDTYLALLKTRAFDDLNIYLILLFLSETNYIIANEIFTNIVHICLEYFKILQITSMKFYPSSVLRIRHISRAKVVLTK